MVQSRLRHGGGVVLLPAAVFVLHQLRYLLALGPRGLASGGFLVRPGGARA